MNKAFEKILERLEEVENRLLNESGDIGCTLGITNMSEYSKQIVQEVAEEYTSTENINCSTDTSTDGWIPCSERLPDEGVDVLVWLEYFRYGNYNRLYQTMGISYTYNGDWSGFVNGSSEWRDLRIIAWQPLPEPYKE